MRVVLPFKLVGQKLVKGRDFPKSVADGSKDSVVIKVGGIPDGCIAKGYFKLSWENNTTYDLTFNGDELVVDEYIVTLPAYATNKYIDYKFSFSVAIWEGDVERLTTNPVEIVLEKSNYSGETTNTPDIPESQYDELATMALDAKNAADAAGSSSALVNERITLVVLPRLENAENEIDELNADLAEIGNRPTNHYASTTPVDVWGTKVFIDNVPIEKGHLYQITLTASEGYVNTSDVGISVLGTTVKWVTLSANKTHTENYFAKDSGVLKVDTYVQGGKGGTVSVDVLDMTLNAAEISRFAMADDRVRNSVFCKAGGNLFNKADVTKGYYLDSTGSLTANDAYCVSGFIPVKPNTTYAATGFSNGVVYNDLCNRIEPLYGYTYTTPTGAAFFRLSVSLSVLDTFMLNEGAELLPYEPYGGQLSIDNFTDDLLNDLSDKIATPTAELPEYDYFGKLREHLANPFIKTTVKTTGDSITAGVGGTGWTAPHNRESVCWANMLFDYFESRYGGYKEIEFDDWDEVSVGKSGCWQNGISLEQSGHAFVYVDGCVWSNNGGVFPLVSFPFYGDKFKVRYRSSAASGKFTVYVDDNLLETVDCYAAETNWDTVKEYTGLSLGEHTVRIESTNDKNAQSTKNELVIVNAIIPKTIECQNLGASGSMTPGSFLDWDSISAEDDFVFMQYGTNDRFRHLNPVFTQNALVNLFRELKDEYGITPILMSSCPADEYNETTRDEAGTPYYNYHMWDVREAVANAAKHYKVPFVDNYTAFFDYAEIHDVEFETLLVDGLHPNDLGYKVMFDNIVKSLGMSKYPAYKSE